MDTKRYTPELLVNENLEFSIPLYQRLFTWGEEQVLGLLNDLRDHFEKDHSKKRETPYYLGMLSCIKKGGRYELIDGQQRFTVMMLMGIVLKDNFDEWGRFLANGKRVHFAARSKDRDYLESRSRSKVGEKPSPSQSNAKMEEAIRVIERFMSEFQSNEQKNCFAQDVFKRMSFFFSELPPEYMDTPASLNKYFEAMNAQGKSLEPHEILKVDLMREEPDKEFLTRIWNAVSEMDTPIIKKAEGQTKEAYRKMYEDAIELCRNGQYKEAFFKCTASYDVEDDETIGSIQAEEPKPTNTYAVPQKTEKKSVLTFPLFLRLVLDIHRSLEETYSYYRKDLISIFKDKTYRPSDIISFHNDLLFFRLLNDFYLITIEEGAEGNRYSLLYGNGQEEKNYRDKDCVIQYQSMLYVSQTPIYKWIKPLLVRLRDHSPADMHELLTQLKEIDDMGRKLPGKDELSYNIVDRYWFWRLDYYLWEKAGEYFEKVDQEIVNDYVFRSNRSIEHLHPRHQEHNNHWEDADIQSFGNLAMISQSFNSEQSDDPVTVKFARILDQANNHSLQSLKLYKMYLDAEKIPGGWTVQVKDKHQEKMYGLLEESFKRN